MTKYEETLLFINKKSGFWLAVVINLASVVLDQTRKYVHIYLIIYLLIIWYLYVVYEYYICLLGWFALQKVINQR